MPTARRSLRRWFTAPLLVAAVVASGAVALEAPARAATSITLDGTSAGRTFDGVGAVSGGGGNSRLLIDYPEPQRGQVLDYLFRPGYGAALQILKVEIGGDTNSTSGAEPSHQHVRGDLDCNRGYEWWLMEQAKARNPDLRLVALAWGAPGWLGNGTFLSDDTINYLIAWLGCAAEHHLSIDYLTAAQNEKKYDANWTIKLRSALDSKGYAAVKLVFGDDYPGSWGPANVAAGNQALRAAIDVIGAHYPCGYLSAQTSCTAPANALNSGETLWNSEGGSQDYNGGAKPLARGINRSYLDGRMTAYFNWPLVASVTPNLPWATTGLVLAHQPWSGYHAVGKNAWTVAHTTQFTRPGWKYLDSSSGYLDGNRANGSYVTLKSTNGTDYSTVIETMDATAARTLTFTAAGGLSTGAVHVWASNLNSAGNADYLLHTGDLTPSNGSYSVTVQPGYLYTLTTTTGQGKGTATGPAQKALGLPYSDSLDSYPAGKEARYLMDMQGAFETRSCGGGRTGGCVRQMTEQSPIVWKTVADPYALLGDTSWRNYTVTTDVLLEKAGYVEVIGRAGAVNTTKTGGQDGYFFRVADTGVWSLLRINTDVVTTTLRSGTTTALGLNRWHTLSLTVADTTLTARVDGAVVATVTDSTLRTGQVGIGTSQGETAQFDNLSVSTGTATLAGAGR